MPRSGPITVKSTPAKSLNWAFQTLDQFPADPQEQAPVIACRSPGLPIRQSAHHGGGRWADRQQEQLLWCSDSGPGSSLSVRHCRARHPAIHLLNKEFSRRRWTRGSSARVTPEVRNNCEEAHRSRVYPRLAHQVQSFEVRAPPDEVD